MSNEVYEFGPFILDPTRLVLLREGKLIPVGTKDFEVLQELVQNWGNTVTKEDLLKRVWNINAEENYLAQSISKLRKALSDSTEEPLYIKTIPGEGYRFIAGVRKVSTKAEK